MNLQQIPRTIVNRSLDVARLPLDTVARFTGDGERFGIAVDRLESGVREAAGRLLNDDTLVGDARLQRTEAGEREKALRHRLEAERTKRAGARRAKTVEQRADERKQAERQRAERRQEAIERRERTATKGSIQKKTAALDAKERALRTKATADRLEDAAKATKAKRKTRTR